MGARYTGDLMVTTRIHQLSLLVVNCLFLVTSVSGLNLDASVRWLEAVMLRLSLFFGLPCWIFAAYHRVSSFFYLVVDGVELREFCIRRLILTVGTGRLACMSAGFFSGMDTPHTTRSICSDLLSNSTLAVARLHSLDAALQS